MPTFKYGGTSTLTLSERITTPSLHIQKDGNHWYVPLFEGDAGSEVAQGSYKYTLGSLKFGDFRVAISRTNNTYTNTIRVSYNSKYESHTSSGTRGYNQWSGEYLYYNTITIYGQLTVQLGGDIQQGMISKLKIGDKEFLNPSTGQYYQVSTDSITKGHYTTNRDLYPSVDNPPFNIDKISVEINGETFSFDYVDGESGMKQFKQTGTL